MLLQIYSGIFLQRILKKVFKRIVLCAPKISLILDESTSESRTTILIVYVRLQLPKINIPTNIFVDLMEFDDLTAEGIMQLSITCVGE